MRCATVTQTTTTKPHRPQNTTPRPAYGPAAAWPPKRRRAQGAKRAGKANHAGMELVFRLAQAHPAPELHRHPCEAQRASRQTGEVAKRRANAHRRTTATNQGLAATTGPHGRHGQWIHPSHLGPAVNKEASKYSGMNPAPSPPNAPAWVKQCVAKGIGAGQPAWRGSTCTAPHNADATSTTMPSPEEAQPVGASMGTTRQCCPVAPAPLSRLA